MKHIYLRQMLEWRMEIDHDWSVPVGLFGKGLRKRLPPAIWCALEQTYVGPDMADNWNALMRTIELFHQVAMEVGDSLEHTYPDALHQRVRAYVERIRHMGDPHSNGDKPPT